jgi:hypothetical protein
MLIKATGIVGAQNQFYIIYLTKILKGRVKFIYSAPDRLETKKFKENVLNNSVAKIRNNWTETVNNTKSVCSGAKCQRKTFFFLDTSISRPTPMPHYHLRPVGPTPEPARCHFKQLPLATLCGLVTFGPDLTNLQ